MTTTKTTAATEPITVRSTVAMRIELNVENRNSALENLKKALQETLSLTYTLSWKAEDILAAEHNLRVALQLQEGFQKLIADGKSDEQIAAIFIRERNSHLRQILSRTKSPSQSTSPMHNLATQYETASYVTYIEMLEEAANLLAPNSFQPISDLY